MSAVEVLVTRVTKALVPEHAACLVLDRKNRNIRNRHQEGSVICGVNRIVAVVGTAFVDVVVSVDVYVAVFPVLERRDGRSQRLDDR